MWGPIWLKYGYSCDETLEMDIYGLKNNVRFDKDPSRRGKLVSAKAELAEVKWCVVINSVKWGVH